MTLTDGLKPLAAAVNSHRSNRSAPVPAATLSVVIPTLNEREHLRATLDNVRSQFNGEIVIADGGSSDDTLIIAEAFGVTIVESSPGRGVQMNAGAAAASGDILLFLHADTLLPDGFRSAIEHALRDPETAAGAFRLHIDSRRLSLRLISTVANLRARWLFMPYGDQALFMHRGVFEREGGYPEYAAMEDYCLVRRLRRCGRVAICRQAVVTSARRWEQRGPWRTTALNQLCVLAHRLGVDPARIARWRSGASAPVKAGCDQAPSRHSTEGETQSPACTR